MGRREDEAPWTPAEGFARGAAATRLRHLRYPPALPGGVDACERSAIKSQSCCCCCCQTIISRPVHMRAEVREAEMCSVWEDFGWGVWAEKSSER